MTYLKATLLSVLLAMFLLPQASAGRADPFRGWYEILSQSHSSTLKKEYFLFDADTLGALWERYGEGPLPADLEQYRQEPSILAGFTDRSLIFFGLERGALIANGYVALQGGPEEKLELRRRADGKFDMVVREKERRSIYFLEGPRPTPNTH